MCRDLCKFLAFFRVFRHKNDINRCVFYTYYSSSRIIADKFVCVRGDVILNEGCLMCFLFM